MGPFKRFFSEAVSASCWIASALFFFWSCVIIAAQSLGWLRFGMWQQIPAFVAFMQPNVQRYSVVPVGLWDASWSPLGLTPSLGSYVSAEDIATAISGHLLGLQKLVIAGLQLPLSGWLIAVSVALFVLAVNLEEMKSA